MLFFFWSRLWFIFFIMPFISLGMSLVATVGDSLLTSLVEEHEQVPPFSNSLQDNFRGLSSE